MWLLLLLSIALTVPKDCLSSKIWAAWFLRFFWIYLYVKPLLLYLFHSTGSTKTVTYTCSVFSYVPWCCFKLCTLLRYSWMNLAHTLITGSTHMTHVCSDIEVQSSLSWAGRASTFPSCCSQDPASSDGGPVNRRHIKLFEELWFTHWSDKDSLQIMPGGNIRRWHHSADVQWLCCFIRLLERMFRKTDNTDMEENHCLNIFLYR